MQHSLQELGSIHACMAKALLAATLAGASLAHAQGVPQPPLTAQQIAGPFAPPKLPALAHEVAPVEWPVPDYYAQALDATGLQAGSRASALRLHTSASELPGYIVLPVQVQAFGFSPQFRALAGALLDRQLEAAGLQATQQTDITDAYGPFVRRFSEASIEALAAENPGRKTISLYLGHDGIDQMFITLVVREGKQRKTAHKTIAMPADAKLAADQLVQILPGLLKDAGLPARGAAAAASGSTTCDARTWSFAPPARNASNAERACHAIAIGMLLPSYDSSAQFRGVSEEMSPAKLAWLARAYTLATAGTLATDSAEAIRQLAQKGLGLSKEGSGGSLPRPNDPVVQRLIKLEQLKAASETAPVRSTREARARQLESMTRDLPDFAAALFSARTDFQEPLATVDLCAIERLLPQTMLRAICRDGSTTAAPTRAPWPAETLMYQEWRLASFHKELSYAALVQGSRPRAEAALSRWPKDVSEHPYLQRLRYVVSTQREVSGSFDEQLKASRDNARAVTQTSVDLQRADRWLASNSLAGHMWADNTNILNDPQVREITDKETRLLSVLRFDRFTQDRYLAKRQPGDTAFFLGSPMWVQMAAGGMPYLVVTMEPSTENPGPPASVFAPRHSLFAAPRTLFDGWTDKDLRQSLARNPADLTIRLTVALGQLQDGGSMAEALKLIDAQPVDQRTDNRIEQSHTWATPAHYFYFAGELGAARKYYQKVADIGTGSDSDLMARIRLKLMDHDVREGLRRTTARVDRYDSDFARRDQASLLFMFGQPDKAWDTFMSRAASAAVFQLWVGAYTGHRMEKATLDQIDAWVVSKKLDRAQIDRKDTSQLYRHLHVVMDRLPQEADIQRLKRPLGAQTYVGPMLSTSAQLFRSALLETGFAEAFRDATSALKNAGGDPSSSYMQPLYAWAAWQASAGKDEFIQEVRATTRRSGFDEMLAKAMVLALDGDTKESLRFYTAARFQLAVPGDRWIPAQYTYALAGFLMYRKTGDDAYRQETLRFVRSQQVVFPYYGWLYAMEALLESDAKKRREAACRARYMDPDSYFLSLAKVPGLDANACKESLASLLR